MGVLGSLIMEIVKFSCQWETKGARRVQLPRKPAPAVPNEDSSSWTYWTQTSISLLFPTRDILPLVPPFRHHCFHARDFFAWPRPFSGNTLSTLLLPDWMRYTDGKGSRSLAEETYDDGNKPMNRVRSLARLDQWVRSPWSRKYGHTGYHCSAMSIVESTWLLLQGNVLVRINSSNRCGRDLDMVLSTVGWISQEDTRGFPGRLSVVVYKVFVLANVYRQLDWNIVLPKRYSRCRQMTLWNLKWIRVVIYTWR